MEGLNEVVNVAKMFFGLIDPVSLGLDLLDLFLVEDDVPKI